MLNNLEIAVKNIKGREYAGSSVKDGFLYHDIPFEGFENLESHRKNNLARFNLIKKYITFTGKTVIDLGSSVGGLSLLAANEHAKQVIGYDQDERSINVGQIIASRLKMNNITFIKQNIDLSFVQSLDKVDIILVLSCAMWFYKEYGAEIADLMLREISKKADIMIFEIAGHKDGLAPMPYLTQDKVVDFLTYRTLYTKFNNIGYADDNWKKRNIIICKD